MLLFRGRSSTRFMRVGSSGRAGHNRRSDRRRGPGSFDCSERMKWAAGSMRETVLLALLPPLIYRRPMAGGGFFSVPAARGRARLAVSRPPPPTGQYRKILGLPDYYGNLCGNWCKRRRVNVIGHYCSGLVDRCRLLNCHAK